MPWKSQPGAAPASPQASTSAPKTNTKSDWLGTSILGGLGVAGALALRRPDLAAKSFETVRNIRQTEMLMGEAPLKSILGNIGGTVNAAIHHGSMKPIKELFSMDTAREVGQALKHGPSYSNVGPGAINNPSWYNLPGRFMSALDEGAQGALKRAGLSGKEAEARMLQSPIDSPMLTKGLDNPVMQLAVPFRRNAANQLNYGGLRMGDIAKVPQNAAEWRDAAATSGAIWSGYMNPTDDPKTFGLHVAAAGERGLPVMAGRATRLYVDAIRGGKEPSGAVSQAARGFAGSSPISEFGLASTLNPLRPFQENKKGESLAAPASAYRHLRKLFGMDD